MVIIEKSGGKYGIFHQGKPVGTITLYDNPYHRKNCYVTLDMEALDKSMSGEMFRRLRDIAGRPLQMMVSSDDAALTDFLLAGGFICKRKCYEVEAGMADYIGKTGNIPLYCSTTGETEYEQSCRLMYDHYVASHEKINPWTAGFEAFCRELPQKVIYTKIGTEITNLAFVEDSEIAYVYGKDSRFFKEFAQNLATSMLTRYETICFESDDCDWTAMQLRALFQNQKETSYDTYVYDNKGTIPNERYC